MTFSKTDEDDLAEGVHMLSFDQILVRQALDRAIEPSLVKECVERQLSVMVAVPADPWTGPVYGALHHRFDKELSLLGLPRAGQRPLIFRRDPPSRATRLTSSTKDETLEEIKRWLRNGCSVVGVFGPSAAPLSVFVDHVDVRIEVRRPSSIDLAEAISAFTGHDVAATDLPVPDTLDLDALALSVRPRAPIIDTIRRIQALTRSSAVNDGVPGLGELAGYGDAQKWGLRLARNVARLRAGDSGMSAAALPRGVLLVGPAGTGKSIYGRALAKTAGVPIVVTSASEWLSSGDGNLAAALNAARASIERARTFTPGILFVDEIDSLRDRDHETGRNSSWWINFVNGILTMIDGVIKKPGLILVGACNNADRVDKALKRAGRLDTIIEITLPRADDRRKILALYAKGELSDEALSRCARIAEGFTGADLEKAIRDARDTARDAERSMTEDDVLKAISPPADVSETEIWEQAVHEAGHAVVGALLGFRLASIQVAMTGSAGGLTIVEDSHRLKDVLSLERLATMILAGRASDEIVGGAATTGAGGDVSSDIAKATSLIAGLHGSWALRETLAYRGGPAQAAEAMLNDAGLRAKVEDDLRRCLDRARAIVLRNVKVILVLADALSKRRFLAGSEAHEVIIKAGGVVVSDSDRTRQSVS